VWKIRVTFLFRQSNVSEIYLANFSTKIGDLKRAKDSKFNHVHFSEETFSTNKDQYFPIKKSSSKGTLTTEASFDSISLSSTSSSPASSERYSSSFKLYRSGYSFGSDSSFNTYDESKSTEDRNSYNNNYNDNYGKNNGNSKSIIEIIDGMLEKLQAENKSQVAIDDLRNIRIELEKINGDLSKSEGAQCLSKLAIILDNIQFC